MKPPPKANVPMLKKVTNSRRHGATDAHAAAIAARIARGAQYGCGRWETASKGTSAVDVSRIIGFKPEEMIDYPGIDYVGVGSLIQMISESKQVVFL